MARTIPKEQLKRRTRERCTGEVEKHISVLREFVKVYCRAHHNPPEGGICDECHELLIYARLKILACPYDPKPKCKNCPTQCYKPEMREKVREIMRYSGMHFAKRGRLDWLVKYFMQRPTVR